LLGLAVGRSKQPGGADHHPFCLPRQGESADHGRHALLGNLVQSAIDHGKGVHRRNGRDQREGTDAQEGEQQSPAHTDPADLSPSTAQQGPHGLCPDRRRRGGHLPVRGGHYPSWEVVGQVARVNA